MPYTIRIELPRLDNIAAKIPDALVSALNSTAFVAKRDTEDAMRRVIDRPTPIAMRSIMYSRAGENGNKAFESSVQLKTEGQVRFDPGKVLLPLFGGGNRHHKRFEGRLRHHGIIEDDEYLVPTRAAKRDAYGNVPSGPIIQMLSALYAWETNNGDTGFRSNRTAKSGLRFRAKNGGDWIMPAKSGPYYRRQLKKGIYWRDTKGRTLVMWFKVVRHAPTYKQRLSLHDIVRGAIRKEFWTKFSQKIR
jgi:hypothetical protein